MRAWQEVKARYRLMQNAWTVIISQQRQISELERAAKLMTESSLTMAEAWLISLDQPEQHDEIREDVLSLVEALRNDLAQLQEHVV